MKLNVDIHYGKEATADEILSGNYDKVILATGSKSRIPNIKGIEFAKTADDYLTGTAQPKNHVVVIGGGLVGCETALFMSEFTDNVTIVEQFDDILKTVEHSKNNDLSLRDRLSEAPIDILTSSLVKEITNGGVVIEVNGEEKTIKSDTTIIAAGYIPINSLEEEIEDYVDVTVVGDAVKSRKILDAVHEAYHAIRVM